MNAWRAIRFMLTVFTIWGGSNFYMASRLIGPSALTGHVRTAVWAIAAVLTVLVPAAMFSQRKWRAPAWLTWTAYLYMGFSATLLPLVALRDLVRAGAYGVTALWSLLNPHASELVNLDRWASWTNTTSLGILGLAMAFTLAGFVEARRLPRAIRITIPIPELPAGLVGFRIAHISDLHAGGTIARSRLEHVVREVNAFDPDIIALTGDLADGNVAELIDHVAPITELKARYGTFFSTGNHEYYWDPMGWLDHIRELGLTVLLNEHRIIHHAGATVMVAGVTDPSSHEMVPAHVSDPATATATTAGSPQADFTLLLAHQPSSAFAAEKAGVSLQLSGHTHGGQFFPWLHLVNRVQPFLAGLYPVGRMRLYVNRGAGYWGPPNRLGVPAEIALLTLTRTDQPA